MLRICDISWTVSVMTLVCDWSARLPRHHYTGSVFGDKRRAAPSFSDFDQSDRLEVIISANQRFVPRVFESWSGWRWSGMTQSSRRSWAAPDPGWPWWSSPWAGEWVCVRPPAAEPNRTENTYIHTYTHLAGERESEPGQNSTNRPATQTPDWTEDKNRTNTGMT